MCGVEKKLLYITSEYPNARGDTAFIDTEIKYVAQVFDCIYVLSHGDKNAPCIPVPSNVKVFYFNKPNKNMRFLRYISRFRVLFHAEFWKEIFLILKHKKTILCCKAAVSFLACALKEKKQIQLIAKKYNITLFYTFWFYHSTLACYIALKHMGFAQKPMCTRTHRFDLYEFRNSHSYQPYKIQMDKFINRIFFISNQGLQYYKNTFATRSNDIYKLCYLGTENEIPFEPHEYTDTIRLLSVSNVVSVKRVYLIVDALSECAKSGIKIKWTHIGDGPELEKIKVLAKEKLGSKNSVLCHFLGAKTNTEVHEYYKENTVDLFVNMSESEGLPVSMMEAMSYGVPVAAPDVGGISELVDDKSGWLLSKDNCVKEFFEIIKAWTSMSESEKH